jgi:hypothetical protein
LRKIISLTALVAALVLGSTTAFAATTFDVTDGTGSVAKGDLQQWLGLKNNAQAQTWFTTYSESVYFVFSTQDQYSVKCQFEAGQSGNIQTITVPKNVNVNSEIAYTGRGNSNWAGFTLTGWGSEAPGSGTPPQVGDPCPGGSNLGDIIEVLNDGDPVSSTGGTLTMYGGGPGTPLVVWSAP